MATKSIGYVAELQGSAEVRGVDGIIRILKQGDEVYEGDFLTTATGTRIVLEFYDGDTLQLGENIEILLDETVFAGLDPFPEASVNQLDELRALDIAVNDDDKVLEDPEAFDTEIGRAHV